LKFNIDQPVERYENTTRCTRHEKKLSFFVFYGMVTKYLSQILMIKNVCLCQLLLLNITLSIRSIAVFFITAVNRRIRWTRFDT